MTAVNTRRKKKLRPIRKTVPVDVLNRSCKPAFAVLPPGPSDFLLTRVSPLATQDDSTTPDYPRKGSSVKCPLVSNFTHCYFSEVGWSEGRFDLISNASTSTTLSKSYWLIGSHSSRVLLRDWHVHSERRPGNWFCTIGSRVRRRDKNWGTGD